MKKGFSGAKKTYPSDKFDDRNDHDITLYQSGVID